MNKNAHKYIIQLNFCRLSVFLAFYNTVCIIPVHCFQENSSGICMELQGRETKWTAEGPGVGRNAGKDYAVSCVRYGTFRV